MRNKIQTLLFLDDIRDPFENDGEWLVFSPLESPFKTIWVKSYDELTDWIYFNGLPDGVCFDHDLGWDEDDNDLPNGFHCANWIVNYCLHYRLPFPKYNIQSANPVGKENIEGIIKSLKKFRKMLK
jgi:hypothetical protein